MGLARRGALTWEGRQKAAETAAAAGAAALRFGAGIWRSMRLQLDQGHAPALRPQHLRWPDGRRFRASAVGRRRGYSTGGRPATRSSGTAAMVSMLLVLAVAVGSFVGVSALWVKYASDLPDAHSIALAVLPQDSIIYDSTGSITLADIHRQGYRHYEQKLADMGTLLPQATIAIEDAKFYSEPGIDVTSIVRAAWVDYHDHAAVQGASTITQQLVKLRLLGNKPSIDRKAKEAVLALQVEQDFTKKQILEMYLNTAFFGNNAYGVQAAAQSYFHVPTAKLDLAQAAMLAGIPQNPTYNNPLVNWEGARNRQHLVLQAMVRNHAITQVQADQAFAEDLTEPNHMFRDSNVIVAPGFVAFVLDELKARFGVDAPYQDGFRVTTSLNLTMQRTAQDLIAGQVYKYQSYGANVHQGAMVGIDPKTGEILSMVGSANVNDNGGQYNFAVWPPRNPGSSMKIFNYTAAIASGKFTMVTPIPDTQITFPADPGVKPYQPRNYDGRLHGTCQLQQCFLNSYNIPAVKVEVEQGIGNVVTMARAMGAPPWRWVSEGVFVNNDPLDAYGPSLTLGGYGETPLQMATGASVLADGGLLRQIHSVRTVTSATGAPIFKSDPNQGAKQVVDPKVAFIMDQIMSDDSNRQAIFGRGSNLTLPDRKVASKTGTTDDYKDGWTVGFTPALATAFWFGNPDSSPMPVGAEASEVAAPVWNAFMHWATDAALQEPGGDWFAEPPGLDHYNVAGKYQWFLPGTNPSTPQPPLPAGVKAAAPRPPPTPAPAATPPPDNKPPHGGGGGGGG
ncbi:MAG TPA: transglycosylase domain-containing protein [Candidatus Dormibacteraeota bacterium]|jgi:membrane peptidoglycan carboxypeptidase